MSKKASENRLIRRNWSCLESGCYRVNKCVTETSFEKSSFCWLCNMLLKIDFCQNNTFWICFRGRNSLLTVIKSNLHSHSLGRKPCHSFKKNRFSKLVVSVTRCYVGSHCVVTAFNTVFYSYWSSFRILYQVHKKSCLSSCIHFTKYWFFFFLMKLNLV